LSPDVVVSVGGAATYLNQATAAASIPMVFIGVADPIGAKLVESIRHPGGNATGITNFGLELAGKRLEYLKEVRPSLSKVALLVNPANLLSVLYITQSNDVAGRLGLACKSYSIGSLDGLEAAFDAMMADGMEAAVINAESLFF